MTVVFENFLKSWVKVTIKNHTQLRDVSLENARQAGYLHNVGACVPIINPQALRSKGTVCQMLHFTADSLDVSPQGYIMEKFLLMYIP